MPAAALFVFPLAAPLLLISFTCGGGVAGAFEVAAAPSEGAETPPCVAAGAVAVPVGSVAAGFACCGVVCVAVVPGAEFIGVNSPIPVAAGD